MRYLGNKTKLLQAIEDFFGRQGLRGGSLIDVFTGTGSVGRHFKTRGWRVLANDHLALAYVQARAGIGIDAEPGFERLRASLGLRAPAQRRPQETVLDWLNQAAPVSVGLCARQYAPSGAAGRRFFTDDAARRIDGAQATIIDWRRRGLLDDDEFHLLLCALIEAASRVANISGVYAAYLKPFQPNALLPPRLQAIDIVPGAGSVVAQGEAGDFLAQHQADVLYLDPPYNHRQYAANYHVLEALAEWHRIPPAAQASYEAALYGKTGMRPYEAQRSAFCSRDRAAQAFRDLLARARVQHVVVSYNEEGILDQETWRDLLAQAAGTRMGNVGFTAIAHRRFRSDRRQREDSGGHPRSYRVIEGRAADEVHEWLFHVAVRRPAPRTKMPAGPRDLRPHQVALPHVR